MRSAGNFTGSGSIQRKAFSLIELLVVITIIAILASMLLPAIARAKESARTAKCVSNVQQMSLAVLLYTGDHGYYPPGRYPGGQYETRIAWYDALVPYLGKWTNRPTVLKCPSYKFRWADFPRADVPGEPGVGSYAYNGDHPNALSWMPSPDSMLLPLRKESAVRIPARMIAFGDSQLVEIQPAKIMVGMTHLTYHPEVIRQKTFPGYATEMKHTRARHNGRYQIGFCDGHIEPIRHSTLHAADMESRRIWSADHEPFPTFFDNQLPQ